MFGLLLLRLLTVFWYLVNSYESTSQVYEHSMSLPRLSILTTLVSITHVPKSFHRRKCKKNKKNDPLTHKSQKHLSLSNYQVCVQLLPSIKFPLNDLQNYNLRSTIYIQIISIPRPKILIPFQQQSYESLLYQICMKVHHNADT